MASYKPPIENLPIFDSSLFDNANTAIPDVSDTYLTFPIAQGAETLKDTTVDGDLLVLGSTTIASLVLEDIQCTEIQASGNIFCNTITAQGTGQNINGEGIACMRIDAPDYVSTGTLKYVTLDPPISGVAEPINKVLQNGNDAQNETLINLGGLTMQGNINANFNQIENWNNGTVGGHLYVANGNNLPNDTRAEFGVFNNNGNNGYIMGIGDQAGTLNEFNTFKIADNATGQQYLRIDNSSTQQITLSSDKLLYKTDYTNPASGTSYILNSISTPPMYRQIFSNINQSITKTLTTAEPFWIFGTNIYTGDAVFNYGITSADILFSYFQINISSPDPLVAPNNCQLYLGTTPNYAFDPDKGNRIVFSVIDNGSNQFSFTSTIPIILYYQNGEAGANFDNLYLNIQIQDVQEYTFDLENCNFIVSSYIAGKNTDPLVFNV